MCPKEGCQLRIDEPSAPLPSPRLKADATKQEYRRK